MQQHCNSMSEETSDRLPEAAFIVHQRIDHFFSIYHLNLPNEQEYAHLLYRKIGVYFVDAHDQPLPPNCIAVIIIWISCVALNGQMEQISAQNGTTHFTRDHRLMTFHMCFLASGQRSIHAFFAMFTAIMHQLFIVFHGNESFHLIFSAFKRLSETFYQFQTCSDYFLQVLHIIGPLTDLDLKFTWHFYLLLCTSINLKQAKETHIDGEKFSLALNVYVTLKMCLPSSVSHSLPQVMLICIRHILKNSNSQISEEEITNDFNRLLAECEDIFQVERLIYW